MKKIQKYMYVPWSSTLLYSLYAFTYRSYVTRLFNDIRRIASRVSSTSGIIGCARSDNKNNWISKGKRITFLLDVSKHKSIYAQPKSILPKSVLTTTEANT